MFSTRFEAGRDRALTLASWLTHYQTLKARAAIRRRFPASTVPTADMNRVSSAVNHLTLQSFDAVRGAHPEGENSRVYR